MFQKGLYSSSILAKTFLFLELALVNNFVPSSGTLTLNYSEELRNTDKATPNNKETEIKCVAYTHLIRALQMCFFCFLSNPPTGKKRNRLCPFFSYNIFFTTPSLLFAQVVYAINIVGDFEKRKGLDLSMVQ